MAQGSLRQLVGTAKAFQEALLTSFWFEDQGVWWTAHLQGIEVTCTVRWVSGMEFALSWKGKTHGVAGWLMYTFGGLRAFLLFLFVFFNYSWVVIWSKYGH